MVQAKKIILSLVCLVLSVFSLFMFPACNEKLSYDEIKNDYKQMLQNYAMFFENETVSFSYNDALKNYISESTDDFKKLSNDASINTAIFEPVLKISFEAVNFYIDTQDTSKTSQDFLKSLKNNLSNLNSALESLRKDKQQIEDIAQTSGKEQSAKWLTDYFKSFKNTIKCANNFALDYLNMYEKEILTDNDVEGRVSPKKTTFLLVKSMTQSAQIYEQFVLEDIYDQTTFDEQNFANQMLQNFLIIKDILKNDFNGIRGGSSSASDYETNILQNFTLLNEFQISLNNSISNAQTAVSDYDLKTLRLNEKNGNLSLKQQVCVQAIDELLNEDFPIAKIYNENITQNIKNWKTSQGD